MGARLSHSGARTPTGLLAWSTAVAAAVTAVLNLDATVVLLTPVLIAAAHRDQISARPVAWMGDRMANSASTLLPVSNLTSLLAVSATGLSFAGFTWLMWPVWLVAVVGEWAVTHVALAGELTGPGHPNDAEPPPAPRLPRVVVGVMLGGFVVGSTVGVPPYVAAVAAAVVLASVALRRGRMTPGDVLRSAKHPARVRGRLLGSRRRDLLPAGSRPPLGTLRVRSAITCSPSRPRRR